MNKQQIKKSLTYILSLLIAGVLLYFSFRGIQWNDFIITLSQCNWVWILLSMAAGVMAFWLRSLRWRQLLLPLDRSLDRLSVFNAVNIGNLANFVFPRIGEFVRCGYITSNSGYDTSDSGNGVGHKKASYDKVIGTVVLERSLDLLMMFIILFLLLIGKWDKFGSFFIVNMWQPLEARFQGDAIWIVIAVLAGLLVLGTLVVWLIIRNKNRNKVCGTISSVFEGLWKGFGTCLHMDHKWAFIIYTVLIWTMYWLMSIFVMRAVPSLDNLNMIDGLFLMMAGSLGWLVPVPGGFGAFHYIVALALSTIYMLPFNDGIIFATLSHEAQAVTMLLFGFISFGIESFKRKRAE